MGARRTALSIAVASCVAVAAFCTVDGTAHRSVTSRSHRHRSPLCARRANRSLSIHRERSTTWRSAGCVNSDGTAVSTENLSNGVIRLWALQPLSEVRFIYYKPSPSIDLTGYAIARVTRGGWNTRRGYYDLVPGGRVVILTADHRSPIRLRLDYAAANQAPATVFATWIAGVVENRMPRAAALSRVVWSAVLPTSLTP